MTRLLLVDDDPSIRLSLGALLEDEGFVVGEASSRAEALVRATEGSWELVLLDQHLGDALGTELVPSLRAALPTAKVVIVSGESAVSGGDAFFPKGGHVGDLLRLLRSL